jgi:hypothetical protein
MNESAANDPSKLARSRLTEACRTKDTSVRLAWAITIGEALLLGVLAAALLDYWLMLPIWLRTTGASFIAAMALFGIWRLLRFYRRPTPMKEAALDLEAQRPEFGCEISTAAEYLSGDRKQSLEYEPELVSALETKAADEMRAVQIPYERKLLKPAALLLLVLVALLVFLLLTPSALTALTRAVLPFLNIQYTTVQVAPGDIELPLGQDVVVASMFSGRAPNDPTLHWRHNDSDGWQTVPLPLSTNGAYVHTFTNIQADLVYRITGSDAVSDTYRIATYDPPKVSDLTVTVRPPAYTRLPPSIQKNPDITAVRSSTVHFEITPNVSLSNARLRFSAADQTVPLQYQNGCWTANLTVTTNTEYRIELADMKGRPGVNETPHQIKAVPDLPPNVEIPDPGRDTRASATNTLPVQISVTDDFGIGEIKLVYRKLGGANHELTATVYTNRNGEVLAGAELDLSALGMEDHELIAYHAEASDNNTLDGPGVGKSPLYFVEITDLEPSECKPRVPGQAVNLLEVQKQIAADTAALTSNAPLEQFQELAARQADAVEFARIYLEAIKTAGAPQEAASEMESAQSAMENAVGHLGARQASSALPAEERALAHLYQVLKLMPELEELPTEPPAEQPPQLQNETLAVVLDAIKEKKKEHPEDLKQIQNAMDQAQALAQAQAALNTVMRHLSAATSGQNQGAGQNSSEPTTNQEQQNQLSQKPQNKPKKNSKNQENAVGTEKAGSSKAGEPQHAKAGQQNGQPGSDQAADPEQIADRESEMSSKASELAKLLERLAGKDKRLGHRAGQNAGQAARSLATASEKLKEADFGAAGINGLQGELALRNVAHELQRILNDQPDLADVQAEGFPKEFEAIIAEYFKQLSHAE